MNTFIDTYSKTQNTSFYEEKVNFENNENTKSHIKNILKYYCNKVNNDS